MRPRTNQIRAKQFEVEDYRRQLRLFDQMIRDLAKIRDELGRQIAHEEARTGVRDRSHFAYSTIARAARERRMKLDASIGDLTERKAAVELRLQDAEAALDAYGAEAALSGPFQEPRWQVA